MTDDHPISKQRLDVEWYRGAIATLAVYWSIDRDTVVYDEIIANYDEEELIQIARRDGNMRWSGLSDYLKRKKAREAR